jgi:hypothetical protein
MIDWTAIGRLRGQPGVIWEYWQECVAPAFILGTSQQAAKDGWELVSVLPVYGGAALLIFKRPSRGTNRL